MKGLQLVAMDVTPAAISNPLGVEIENLTVSPHRQVQITVRGPPGQTSVPEMSADLIHWQALQTNTLAGTNSVFVDQTATNADRRFYRISTLQPLPSVTRP